MVWLAILLTSPLFHQAARIRLVERQPTPVPDIGLNSKFFEGKPQSGAQNPL
jgi:hypothetical protein